MAKFLASAKKFVASEDAPTMVEYGLLVALIAVVATAGVTLLGESISDLFGDLGETIGGVDTSI